jgi:hypothetical protein
MRVNNLFILFLTGCVAARIPSLAFAFAPPTMDAPAGLASKQLPLTPAQV